MRPCAVGKPPEPSVSVSVPVAWPEQGSAQGETTGARGDVPALVQNHWGLVLWVLIEVIW